MTIFLTVATIISVSIHALITYEIWQINEHMDFSQSYEGLHTYEQVQIKKVPVYGIWYEDAIKNHLVESNTMKDRVVKAYKLYEELYDPTFLYVEEPEGAVFKDIYDKEVSLFCNRMTCYRDYDEYFCKYLHTKALTEAFKTEIPDSIYHDWQEWVLQGFRYESSFLRKPIENPINFSLYGYFKDLDCRLEKGEVCCRDCSRVESQLIAPLLVTNKQFNPEEVHAFISHKVLKHYWNLITTEAFLGERK